MLARFGGNAPLLGALGVTLSAGLMAAPASAQVFRFTLRAEPDVIQANGISTTSIFVQVPSSSLKGGAPPVVRFTTTAGVIESQAQLSDGVARVLLRSSATPETAIVTAFIGAARESIAVEFAEEAEDGPRTLEIAAPYTAYSADQNVIATSGRSVLDWGDLRIESDVRLDVDLFTERVWAQGTSGGVIIRSGRGAKARVLRGDRLFYDLRRRQGVIRRVGDSSNTEEGARQEFVGSRLVSPEALSPDEAARAESGKGANLLPPRDATGAASSTRDDVGSEPARPRVVPPAPEAAATLPGASAPLPAPTAELEAEVVTTGEDVAPLALVPGSQDDSPLIENAEVENAESAAPENSDAQAAAQADAPAAVKPAPNDSPPSGNLNSAAPTGEEANSELSEPRTTASSRMVKPGEDAPALRDSTGNAVSTGDDAPTGYQPRVLEVPAPLFEAREGYWVTARRLRVFPRDKVQFERAAIYYNGKKAFGVPLYVLPLDGSFNPATDLVAFNSSGGVSFKFPFYYQATRSGTGSLTLRNEPGGGFGTRSRGLSLELEQQYQLSPRSNGRLLVDELGRGDWNLNWQHRHQFNDRTQGALYLSMPRHRDIFARATVGTRVGPASVGIETFYDRPEGEEGTLRGQIYARTSARPLGGGWNYSVAANALAVSRVLDRQTGDSFRRPGLPGQTPIDNRRTRSLTGTTLNLNLRSPNFQPWNDSQFSANLGTTAFYYSDGRSGLAPTLSMGFEQRLGRSANLRLDYTYDRAALGLYGARSDSFTHYLSGSFGWRLSQQLSFSAFASQSLQDGSIYGTSDLSYLFGRKWRLGLFTDYTSFAFDQPLNYGASIGRSVAGREISLNWDAVRDKVYFEIGVAQR